MAILHSYSATFAQNGLASSAVTRWRFNEDAGSATALDGVDALDGSYLAGADPGDAGSIGDGAARFDGATGRVLVSHTLSGTITVSARARAAVRSTWWPMTWTARTRRVGAVVGMIRPRPHRASR